MQGCEQSLGEKGRRAEGWFGLDILDDCLSWLNCLVFFGGFGSRVLGELVFDFFPSYIVVWWLGFRLAVCPAFELGHFNRKPK